MGVERSTQAAAEEAARKAGMSLAEWLDEVVAEQAASSEFGEAREVRSERPPVARARDVRPREDFRAREREDEAPRARAFERPRDPAPAASDPHRDRLEAAIARLEATAARREERTAKALESVAEWIERSASAHPAAEAPAPRRVEPQTFAHREPEAFARRETEAFAAIDSRAHPHADAHVETPAARPRVDLQDAIARIQRRRGELDARQGFEPAPRPARRETEAPAGARPRGEPAVEVLRAEIGELNARLERIRQEQQLREEQKLRAGVRTKPESETADRRLTQVEADSLRGELAAMRRSLGELAPRNGNVALEGAIADLAQRVDAMRHSPLAPEALRPLEDMLRQAVETLRSNDPLAAARAVEADLKALTQRIDALARSAVDPALIDQIRRQTEDTRQFLSRAAEAAPIARLERQIEQLADRTERLADHPRPAPELEKLTAQFAETRTQIERALSPALLRTVEQRLESLGQRIDEALKRPAPTPDLKPVEELARRIDGLKSAFERQAEARPSTERLEAAVAELAQKLDRPQTIEGFDPHSIDALVYHVDSLREAVERQAQLAPAGARLEGALVDIAGKLEQIVGAPGLDGRHTDDLARRVDTLRDMVDRQASVAPTARQIEAAVAEIASKLDRPMPVPRLDPRPLDEIARQLEAVRAAVSQPDPSAPTIAKIEATLAELTGRLDQAAFETRPYEDLAQRFESLKSTIEQQSEALQQTAALEAHIADLGRKLDRPPQGLADQMAIKSTLQALSARVDDGFRKIGERAPAPREPALEVELLDEMARSLGDIRSAVDRQGDFTESANRLESAIADLASRIETSATPAGNPAALQETLQLLLQRLQDWSHGPATSPVALQDLARRLDQVGAALEHPRDVSTELGRLASEVQGLRAKLEATGGAERVQALAGRLDRPEAPASDLRALETLVRELGSRPAQVDTRAIESMFDDLGRRLERATGAPQAIAPLIAAMNKVETRLGALDAAPLEDAIRNLSDRLDAHGPAAFDDEQLERAAALIAERIGPSAGLGADAELLLRQVMQIHDRLDALGQDSGSNAALEKTVGELVAEFEDTRKLLLDVVEPAGRAQDVSADLADIKTEQTNAERRMSGRLNRIQEILEDLSERLRDLEDGPVDASLGAERAPLPPAAASSYALGDIPDRPRPPAAPRPPAQAAAAAFGRSAVDVRATPIEPGALGPRPRAADEAASAKPTDKPTDLQAHIAAARRAAMAEMNARRDAPAGADDEPLPKRAASFSLGALKQAQGVLATRRVPFLIGALLLVAAATVAISELRGGRLPLLHRADLAPTTPAATPLASVETPAPAPTPLAETAAAAPKVDYAPTGAIEAAKPAPAPAASPTVAAPVSNADILALLPQGLPDTLKASVAAGDPAGEIELGLRFVEGRGMLRDPKVGARWIELAATQGQPYAQYRIGALYERGVGVAKDPQLARAWYQKAAAAGSARAQHNLAVMNAEDGGSGKPDYAAAAAGFRAAADYGIRDSQYNLGVLYGRGLGVPEDLALSWLYFSLAAQQGDTDAGKKRDEVAAKMDGKTLAEAQKKLAEFKQKPLNAVANEAPQPAGGWGASSPQASKPATPAPSPSAPKAKS